MAKKFGVGKDQQGGNVVSIPTPSKLKETNPQFTTGYSFPIARMVNVIFDPVKEVNSGGIKVPKPVLTFMFKDDEGRQFSHAEFPIEDDDVKFDSKLEWMNQRIRHIWDETIGASKFPENGIGQEAENFSDFFKDVADTFNSAVVGEGDKQVKLYATTPVYMKLVYNRNRTQFPLFPNFVQRAKVGDKTQAVKFLTIDPSRDVLEMAAKSSQNNAYTGGTDHSFGGGVGADTNDYPDV